jgi:D-glycero-D-manno-heptose 1,7-bisphosphate phosphatase
VVRKAIFLDRDGTIIRNYLEGDTAVPLRTLDEFEILPQVKLAVDLLSSSSFNIVVVTNQPDVARGKTGLEFVQTVNDLIKEKLNIQYFYVCPHDNDDLCTCRKPKAGMIFEAASDLDLSIEDSFLIGDSWKDLAAAEQAGCKSFWVRNDGPVNYEGDYTAVDSLYEAAVMILGDQ